MARLNDIVRSRFYAMCGVIPIVSLAGAFILAAQPPPPAPPAVAEGIKITGGVVEYQVLQRDDRGTGTAPLSGTAIAKFNNKYMEARVVSDTGSEIAGQGWNALNQIKNGKWNGSLGNIPTGGPYRLEVRVSGAPTVSASVEHILVGDLWVLAGQSNMEGVGDLVDVTPPLAEVHSFDMTDVWGIARDPLHTLPSAADRVHWRKNQAGEPERLTGDDLEKFIANRKKGAGPGMPFAVEMFRRTGIPVGLVPCAHGGTSMDQWDPKLKSQGGDSLYGATIRRIQAVGGKIKGILWYQGEADANPKSAPLYEGKFEALIQAFRTDTGEADLPFYYVQIGLHVAAADGTQWNAVQEAERKLELKVPHTGMVAAIDVSLDDPIHVSTQDQKRVGRRLAALAAHDLYASSAKENASIKRGPRPASVKYADHVIRVTFNDVNGQLEAEGRVSGFAVLDPTGKPLPVIFKSQIDPKDSNAILLHVQADLPAGATLRYGLGRDPYCNVRDTADMALPAFGPVPIEGIAAAAPKS